MYIFIYIYKYIYVYIYIYKEKAFIDGESLFYSICEGLNSFFSSMTQKKIYDEMSENISVVSFTL